jgi:hypothetical protein
MVDDTVGIPSSDPSEEQPGMVAPLPAWQKPEISRIAVATTSHKLHASHEFDDVHIP